MKIFAPPSLSIALVSIAFAGVAASGCTVPSYDDSRCSGLLGCSSDKRIGQITDEDSTGSGVGSGPPTAWPAALNMESRSMGCGIDLPADQSLGKVNSPQGYTQYKVMGTGANLTPNVLDAKKGERSFWVRVPSDYDKMKSYPVIYVGQGCGAYNSANSATYHLYSENSGGNEQAIYVALDIPMDHANQDCYDNRDGLASQEWEAFALFQEFIDKTFCADLNRIFVAGYSTGGWLSNMWGCYYGGAPVVGRKFGPKYHVRAQASTTGGEPAQQPTCTGPIAAIWLHDQNDTANAIAGNKSALQRVGKVNNCDTTYDKKTVQTPWAPWTTDTTKTADEITTLTAAIGPICQSFNKCTADNPVVFCTTSGLGHASQDVRAIPIFTYFFNQFKTTPATP